MIALLRLSNEGTVVTVEHLQGSGGHFQSQCYNLKAFHFADLKIKRIKPGGTPMFSLSLSSFNTLEGRTK